MVVDLDLEDWRR
jgi:hypothetical protein